MGPEREAGGNLVMVQLNALFLRYNLNIIS